MPHGVLITGGTGTFGQAFVPHLLRLSDVHRIVVLSRDELKQAEMERGLRSHSDFHKLRFYIGDVRDLARLDAAMYGITHVVHAAALKRIEKCENDPIEAIKTNIQGTANVIEAALHQPRMMNVVGLSTDKAYNPVNLYGATKLAAERLLAAANNLSGGRVRFSAVRYGNVWGSRGSVVDVWRKAIAKGEPITITDPHATRFFMTVSDAVSQVSHQLFKLDPVPLRIPVLRKAYRLGDLLQAMDMPGGTIIHTDGLSKFEKLHESLHEGYSSDSVERMTVDELKRELERI